MKEPSNPPFRGLTPPPAVITLKEATTVIGWAKWAIAVGEEETGVAQIVELYVQPPHRRKRHGRKLVERVIAEAAAVFAGRGKRLRRVWLNVRQKEQVNARAFLTGCGFHHVASIKDLYPDEDGLIYTRSFD